MERKRALISAAVAAVVITTGTAAAAANFGLLGTNSNQLPAGHLDLATVQASPNLAAASETTLSLPPSTGSSRQQPDMSVVSPATTIATTTPVSAPADDDHASSGHGSGHPDGHDDD